MWKMSRAEGSQVCAQGMSAGRADLGASREVVTRLIAPLEAFGRWDKGRQWMMGVVDVKECAPALNLPIY